MKETIQEKKYSKGEGNLRNGNGKIKRFKNGKRKHEKEKKNDKEIDELKNSNTG